MNSTFSKIIENKWVWTFGVIGIILISFFFVPIVVTQFSSFIHFDEQSDHIGSTIGGIVTPTLAFFGILLTFAAFYIQYRANEIQRHNFYIQQFESKFFDLLKIHRDNVSEMTLHNKKQRNVFVILRAEFQDIYEVVKVQTELVEDSSNKMKADISYLFLFFGIGVTTSPLVQELTKKYNIDDRILKIDKALDSLQNSGTSNTKFLKKYKFGQEDYYPFNGHQIRLAHYYRHLFQTVTFVENQEDLTKKQKEYYVKTLRAQLGTHEIAIFFYNSISSLGKPWFKSLYKDSTQKEVNLVTKYQLIKNLPPKYFTFDIEPKTFYPNINYEWDDIINAQD